MHLKNYIVHDSKERAECQERLHKDNQKHIKLKEKSKEKPFTTTWNTNKINPKGTKKPLGPIKRDFSLTCYSENQTYRKPKNAVQKTALFTKIHHLHFSAFVPLTMCHCMHTYTFFLNNLKVFDIILNFPLNTSMYVS